MHSLIATRGRRSAASLPKRGYPSVAVQLLRTGRPSEYQVVDVRSGRSYSFIRAHPETERDRLPSQVRSQIDYRVNVTTGVRTPGHSTRQRIIRFCTQCPGITATDKAPTNVRVCYVQEIASTYIRRGHFQDKSIPVGPVTKLRIEVVPETQRRARAAHAYSRPVQHLVADSILIGNKGIVRRTIRRICRCCPHDSVAWIRVCRCPARW